MPRLSRLMHIFSFSSQSYLASLELPGRMPSLSRHLPIFSFSRQSYNWVSLELPSCIPSLSRQPPIFSFSSPSYTPVCPFNCLAACLAYQDSHPSSHSLANPTWASLELPGRIPSLSRQKPISTSSYLSWNNKAFVCYGRRIWICFQSLPVICN